MSEFNAPGKVPPALSGTATHVPKIQEWDPEGDVHLPLYPGAELFAPPIVRAPPQLPRPEQHPHRPEFPPRGYFRSFVTTPGSLDNQLGFTASSVRVDNYSSHWLFFPGAGMYVPPGFYGVILELQPGTMIANWVQQGPPGRADATTLVDSIVLTIWYEQENVPDAGTPFSGFSSLVVNGPSTLASPVTLTGSSGSPTASVIQSAPGNNLFLDSQGIIYFAPSGTVAAWQMSPHLLAYTDNAYDIGGSGANRPRVIYAASGIQSAAYLAPGNGSAVGGALWDGSGVPGAGLGNNGDYYFRTDTPATANQRIYVKSAGAWVGIV